MIDYGNGREVETLTWTSQMIFSEPWERRENYIENVIEVPSAGGTNTTFCSVKSYKWWHVDERLKKISWQCRKKEK